jgi:hypothetical protein
MNPLSTSTLLKIWEAGQNEPTYYRALLLLAAACPEEPMDALAKLRIGNRDSRLLTLREWTFGPTLACALACPACGEQLEITLHANNIRSQSPEPAGDEFSLESDQYHVDFRLPCSADLQAVSSCVENEGGRAMLIGRCIRRIRSHEGEIGPDRLPASVVEAVVNRMAELDPQADTRLLVTCSACNHAWHAFFDIVSFFWSEIQTWAFRTLQEVHLLASAYGWGEGDILSMSPVRRRLYLEMARG